jgi:hypothetical protein
MSTQVYQRKSLFTPIVVAILVLAVAFFIAIGLIFSGGVADPAKAAADVSTDAPTPEATETAAGCPPQFVQVASANDGHKVNHAFAEQYKMAVEQTGNVSDGFRSVILEQSGKDVSQLTINAYAFKLIDNPNARDGLVADGCLSQEGIKLHNQLEGALKVGGMTFEEVDAPENAYNSGVGDDGLFGVSSTSGIYGDRRAIKVTMKDGSVVYIMIRCGNPVFPGKPNLPEVPTDNPPPPTTENPPPTHENPPPQPGKEPSQDPYPRGNAPVGGGPNSDPGPGQYIAPENMQQPPSQPYVAPQAPAPQPPAQQPNNPQPVPTQDSAPPPPAETTAPKPEAPETGCVPMPGVNC